MGENRNRCFQGLVQEELFDSIGHVILSSDDMADPVPDVIHHITEQIERTAVGSDNDKIVYLIVGTFDTAENFVVITNSAFTFWNFETDHRGMPCLLFLLHLTIGQMSAGAVVAKILFGGEGCLSFLFKFFLGAETMVGLTLLQKLLGRTSMVSTEIGLKIGAFIPVDTQPFKAFDDTGDGFFR